MNINQFISYYSINEVDAIVMKKRFFGMLDHYVIYMGMRLGHPVFIANYKDGVKEVSNEEITTLLSLLEPTRIDRFKGNFFQKQEALQRAWSRVGEKAYDYLENCEHFKNWVHNGTHRSEQSDNFKAGSAFVLGTVALIGVVGAIVKSFDDLFNMKS